MGHRGKSAEITHDEYMIPVGHPLIPAADHLRFHGLQGVPGTIVKSYDLPVAEMKIGNKIYFHQIIPLTDTG